MLCWTWVKHNYSTTDTVARRPINIKLHIAIWQPTHLYILYSNYTRIRLLIRYYLYHTINKYLFNNIISDN